MFPKEINCNRFTSYNSTIEEYIPATINQSSAIMANFNPKPAPAPPDATCYLCLDEGTDDQPLRRECACRGSAGWAHRDCLANYASTQLDSTLRKRENNRARNGPEEHLICPFIECGQCKQPHQGQLMIDMVQEYVTALKSRLPDTHEERYTSRLCLGNAYKQHFFLDPAYMAEAMKHYTNVMNDLNEERRDLIVSDLPPDHPDQRMVSPVVKCDMLATASELLAESGEEAGLYVPASEYYQLALKFARLLPVEDSDKASPIKRRCGELQMKLDRVRNRMVDNGRPGLNYISFLRTKIDEMEKREGKSSPEVLQEKEKLATALFDHGKVEEAHRLAVATQKQCIRVFGPNHLRTKDIELLVGQTSGAKGSTNDGVTNAAASFAGMNLEESNGRISYKEKKPETTAKRRGKKKTRRGRRK